MDMSYPLLRSYKCTTAIATVKSIKYNYHLVFPHQGFVSKEVQLSQNIDHRLIGVWLLLAIFSAARNSFISEPSSNNDHKLTS